ncbi:MAG TPA: AAA family ATPase [Stellaceae bacterium]|nr:AAA family ATPase [Stellaceae bacterium]
MKYLDSGRWNKFLRPDGSFDGRLFEQLVERLLNLHFGGGWRITKVSWDGGKDAVTEEVRELPDGRREITASWAECKLHKKPIALRAVSNTLVMAIVDEARRLLLFSYSSVIDNARLHLARFSAATGIGVEIVDDELLEDLILSHIGALRIPFFPDLAPDSIWEPPVGGLQIVPRLTRDIDVDPLRLGDDEDSEAKTNAVGRVINLRSLLRLQLAVRNRRLSDATEVTVTVDGAEPLTSPFELVNRDDRTSVQTIPPFGLSLFEYYFRPIHAGGSLRLPTLHVSASGDESRLVELGQIAVRSLLIPPLLGGRFHEFIADFRHHVSLRVTSTFTVISGQAGVGKSRITGELMAVLLSKGVELHTFDGAGKHGGGFRAFARKLCAALYRLPDFSTLELLPKRGAQSSSDKGEVGLQRILYDDAINPADHVDEILVLVKRALSNRAVALIVDNVQYLDHSTIRFLADLVQNYREAVAKLVGIFVFNTDFLSLNQQAASFREFLYEIHRTGRDQVLRCDLGDLSSDEVNLFLDHLISTGSERFEHGFTFRYPLMAELVRRRVMPRPLHLLQTMFYLADALALRRQGDFLYIEDIDRLHEALNSVPTALHEILRERWRRVLATRPALEPAGRLLAQLRAIRPEDTATLGISGGDREALIVLGFARENELGELTFFHEQVERSFAKEYENVERNVAASLADRLADARLDEVYFPSYFIAAAQSGIVNDSLVKRASLFLNAGLSNNNLNVAFGERLRHLIRERPNALQPAEELRIIHALAILVSASRGLIYRLRVFDAEVKARKRQLAHYRQAGQDFVELLHEHASWYFGTQEDDRARRLLNEACRLIDSLEFPSHRAKEISRARILNRLCVAHKSLADRDAALAAGRASLAIGERLEAPELIFVNHVDLGYIYYGSLPVSAELFNHWRKAVDCYDAHEAEISDKAFDNLACANLIRAQLLILENRLDEAGKVIDVQGPRCMRELDAFFGVSFMLLQIIRQLLSPDPQRRIELLRELTDRAIDACQAYNVNRIYWKALHARAKVELLSASPESTMAAFAASLHQLQMVTTETSEILYRYFYEDMAIAARCMKVSLPVDAGRVRNSFIRQRMTDIMSLTQPQFEVFMDQYKPCATFNDGRSNLPCL